jgi:TetR/AcrR family transcriptional regulator, transcriptional repressor for nem operon
VLSAAMHAFRRQGYAGLSVTQLEGATGLAASSLYNAYGSKAGLHQRAIAHYRQSVITPRLERFAGPDATLEDLEGLYTSLLEPPLDDGFGCLLINTATELGGRPDGVAAGLRQVAEHLDAVLFRELGHAEDGPVLMLMYEGLLVAVRAGLVEDRHREGIHREFERLRRERDRRGDPHHPTSGGERS